MFPTIFDHRRFRFPIIGLLLVAIFFVEICDSNPDNDVDERPSLFHEDPYTFEAGVYIITQNALDEAPYRYASFLQRILRRMEKQRMPQKEDRKKCDIHYKVTPAAENSKIRLIQDSLTIKLDDRNETIRVSAELSVSIPARVWIWNYLNFLNLWCMYLWTICGGDVVYYDARLRIDTEFKINWDNYTRTVKIDVLPIELLTKEGPRVTGCKPPWFVKLFSSWQKILNTNVQNTVETMAREFQTTLNVPQTFSPVKNGYVKYSISDLIFERGNIILQAEGTFTATIDGKNITFKPQPSARKIGIPNTLTSFQSEKDKTSHLLQGTRLSSTLLTSLMWFADASKETDYHGNTTILDSWINTTIFYKPPIVGIPHDMFLNVSILEGVIKADCTPTHDTIHDTRHDRKTLFEAAFFNLTGNGTVHYIDGSSSNETKPRIILQVENFDLSTLVTKPFKPRIPLPENLQSEIMKALISEMRPVMNAYLQTKAINLPEKLVPFLAHPEIQLFHTKSQDDIAHGYVSLMSYCTCPGETKNIAQKQLTLCSSQSKICNSPFTLIKDVLKKSSVSTEIPAMEEDHDMLGNHIEVVYFQSNGECSLNEIGSMSLKYLLPMTNGRCFSVTEDMQIFYSFDGTKLRFKCFDKFCLKCQLEIEDVYDSTCHAFQNSSLLIGEPCNENQSKYDQNTFILEQYTNENCNTTQEQEKPHLIAIQTSLGEASEECRKASDKNYYKITQRERSVYDISYGCNPPDCKKCFWHKDNVEPKHCASIPPQLSVRISSPAMLKQCEETFSLSGKGHFIEIGFSLGICLLVAIVIVRCRKTIFNAALMNYENIKSCYTKTKHGAKNKSEHFQIKVSAIFKRGLSHIGLRIKTYSPWKECFFKKGGFDELIQCFLLIICGALGIHFSLIWKSKDNPLSLFNNKTFDQLGLPKDYFDYTPMEKFFICARQWSFHGYFSGLCFAYVIAWNFTTIGSPKIWKIIRLTAPILCIVGALMAVILPSVFKSFSGLVHLKRNNDTFVTKNSKAYDFTNNLIQNAVSGLAQSAVSYIWIMVLQGLGGGLYCGSLLYQLLFTYSEAQVSRSMLRILHNFITVASLIQPFICLHPVIIWSQTKDSNTHIHFLPLNIAIWLLIMLTKAFCAFFCDLLKIHSSFNQRKIDYGCLVLQSVIFLSLYGFLMTLFVQYSDNFSRFAIIAIISVFTWGLTLTFILLSIMAERNNDENASPKITSPDNSQIWIFMFLLNFKEIFGSALRQKLYCVYQMIIFIFERKEYSMPNVYGWRIAGRRFFLIIGTSCFTYEVANLYIETANFNAKVEIESLLHQTGYHLSWPDNDTIFSGSFKKLNSAKRNQVWTLLSSVLFFWLALFMDVFPVIWYRNSLSLRLYMTRWLTASRVFCCTGGILIFSSVIVLASPDYLGASSLQEICPDCGVRFNKAVFRLAEFIIGLFFAGVFTAQLLPILITISPALVRASVLMLLHPSLHEDNDSQEMKTNQDGGYPMKTIVKEDSSTPSKVALLDQATNTEDVKMEIVHDSSKDRMRIVLEEMFATGIRQENSEVVQDELSSNHSSPAPPPEKKLPRVTRPKPPVPPRRKKHAANDKGRLLSPENSPQTNAQMKKPQNEVEKLKSSEVNDNKINEIKSQPMLQFSVPQGSPKPTKNGFYINPDNKHLTKLRVSILRNLIFWSSVVAIPITFLSMSVVFQFQNDLTTKLLILAFWSIPISILSSGLFLTRVNVKNMSVLWYYYCLYTMSFFGLFISLVIHVLVSHKKIDLLTEYIKKSSFWCEMISEVFLCNVVISDLIYSSLF